MDYIDQHGGRMRGPQTWNDGGLRRSLCRPSARPPLLEGAQGAPEERWLRSQATALRLWASVRALHPQFLPCPTSARQVRRILNGPKRIPGKVDSWEGDPGNLEWNAIMRDEFDNINELIALLEHGGAERVFTAPDARHEDTFILGPDLVGQLRQKAKIMRAHWLDVQDYLAPPLK